MHAIKDAKLREFTAKTGITIGKEEEREGYMMEDQTGNKR